MDKWRPLPSGSFSLMGILGLGPKSNSLMKDSILCSPLLTQRLTCTKKPSLPASLPLAFRTYSSVQRRSHIPPSTPCSLPGRQEPRVPFLPAANRLQAPFNLSRLASLSVTYLWLDFKTVQVPYKFYRKIRFMWNFKNDQIPFT